MPQDPTHIAPDAEQSLALLEALFAHGPWGFAFLDRQFRYIRVNARLAEMNGLGAEAHVGRTIPEVLGAAQWPERKAIFERVLAGEAVADVPLTGVLALPSGGARRLIASYFPVRAAGEVVGAVALVRDITERAKAQDALRRSEAQLRVIADALPVLIAFVDSDLCYQFNNATYEQWLRKPRAEVTGRHMREVLGEEIYQTNLPEITAALAGRSVRYERALTWPDGTRRFVQGTYAPHVTPEGAVDGFAILVSDLTEHRRTERLLEESEQRYRSLFDHHPDAVFSFDPAGHFVSANAACEAVSGFAATELVGAALLPLIVPEDVDRVRRRFLLAAHGRPQHYETAILHKRGHRVDIQVTNVPIVVEGAILGVYGIAEDITPRKRAEAERSRLLAEVQEASARQEQLVVQQRAFLRDVLASVTGGKLHLADREADLPAPLTACGDTVVLTSTSGLRELRTRADEAARAAGYAPERRHDLMTAVSEAAMNAVVHAGRGEGWLCAGPPGVIQVWIRDHGGGIALDALPKATLARGFSTKASLGHGFKMMLQAVGRVYLLTGATGTTVVLEQDGTSPLPTW